MANKLFNLILFVLLLMDGLFAKRKLRSEKNADTNFIGDIETDYLKIFSDIKQLRAKVPNYPSPDITFEPEEAYLLLRDPIINFKRTSIINPRDENYNALQKTTGADDNTFSSDMFDNFQKRVDDPLHRKHGVGEGLAALPELVKVIKHPEEKSASSVVKSESANLHNNAMKGNNYIKSENRTSTSLGMIREDISLKKLHISPKMDEVTTKKEELELKNKKTLHISPKLYEGKMENKTGKEINGINEGKSDSKSTGVSENHGNDIQQLRNILETVKSPSNVLITKNNTSSSSNSSTNNIKHKVQRNMIVDAGIKGFLAKIETFKFDDVGTKKAGEFKVQKSANISVNTAPHEPISSSIEGKISHRSNITHDDIQSDLADNISDNSNNTHDEPISSNLESNMSDKLNNTQAEANSSNEESKMFGNINNTYAKPISTNLDSKISAKTNDTYTKPNVSNLESKMPDKLNKTHAEANSSNEENKMSDNINSTHSEQISSNLENKISDKTNNTYAKPISSNLESKMPDNSNNTNVEPISSTLESKTSDKLNNTQAESNSSKVGSNISDKSNNTQAKTIASSLESNISDKSNNTQARTIASSLESKISDKSNNTHAEPIPSNLESKISDKSSNMHAEPIPSSLESKISDKSSNTHAESIPSNLESKISDKSNNTHAEPIPSNLESKISDKPSNMHAEPLPSSLESKISDKSSNTHAEPIPSNLESKISDKSNNTQARTIASNLESKISDKPSNMHAEPLPSNLESKISDKPSNTHAEPIPSNLENKMFDKSNQTPFHPHLWRQSNHLLHLASVADELKDKLGASSFKTPMLSKKKDTIDSVFEPECSDKKKCPSNKYCRHFECFDCHNKHHECIADEQCCDDMPCIYGRCDKKTKQSPGSICKNDGDCSNGCCVLEPTINIETGICKIKLGEYHQCSPVLYRKVWIGDKKPTCGPCEDSLECINKGIIATHLVCMKKKT